MRKTVPNNFLKLLKIESGMDTSLEPLDMVLKARADLAARSLDKWSSLAVGLRG